MNAEASSRENHTAAVVIGLLAALLFGTALGWFLKDYFLLIAPAKKAAGTEQAAPQPSVVENKFPLQGKILLSLNPLDVQGLGIKEYLYDLSKLQLTALSIPGVNLSGKSSPDGTKLAFARLGVNAMQIYIGDLTQGGAAPLTTDTVRYKREPTWSRDGSKVAYLGSDVSSDSGDPERWGIYVADLSGNTRLVAHGYGVLFAPNGKALIYLKHDGLYAYDLGSGKESLVWPVTGGVDALSMKLSLSHDGKTLAWSDQTRSKITIFSIDSWTPLKLHVQKELTASGVWAVFSPDDRYLATVTLQTAEDGSNTAALEVYDLQTYASEQLLTLNQYDTSHLWLTDWRYEK